MGLTYLFHRPRFVVVKHISRRIGVNDLGKLVEIAAAMNYCSSAHPIQKSLIFSGPIPDRFTPAEEENCAGRDLVPSPLNPPSGCRFRNKCPYATEILRQRDPELKTGLHGHYAALPP